MWIARRHRKTSGAHRRRCLCGESLERRTLLAADFPQFVDPNPAPGNRFGDQVVPLSTGNVVVTSPFDDAGGTDAGAVYLFNGATGELISTLTGSSPGDQIGVSGVTPLANGNYVVQSELWDNGAATDVGAVTFGRGTSGVSGVVSPANSLVGSTTNDLVGESKVTPLANGNYVVPSPKWDHLAAADAGALTFGSGTTGISGVVSEANSLVGSTAGDRVGNRVTALPSGNYVAVHPQWDNGAAADAGAATFGNGTTGTLGLVSETNSLVGGAANDFIGIHGVMVLANGNYVVSSSSWNNGPISNAGAVTFGSGTSGVVGVVSAANSLVGSSAGDSVGGSDVGGNGVVPLPNGNYLVLSMFWNNAAATKAGALTFSGAGGIVGVVSAANSLVGSTTDDRLGSGGVTVLTNGNYVVCTPNWDNGAVVNVGAATFGNGELGILGPVSAATSLVGGTANSFVGIGGATPLTNGNYVVSSGGWDDGAVADLGAATFGPGDSGISGMVSAANSLVGSLTNDRVSASGITPLTNGNYVVRSPFVDNGAVANVGAATFGDGVSGISGAITTSNSLVGSALDDNVSGGNVTALANGNYVVVSPRWDNGAVTDAGAVTFASGVGGISGTIDALNSLVGGSNLDELGSGRVTALSNGNYVVSSPSWTNGDSFNVGAVTFGSGVTGIQGNVSAANSLIGRVAQDNVGGLANVVTNLVTPLANGNYVVVSPRVNNGSAADAGAVTFGRGDVGVKGTINSINSVIGLAAESDLQLTLDDQNETFYARFVDEAGGIVRIGSQVDGFNAAPVIGSFGGDLTYTENSPVISLTSTATVSDVDSANFAGGRLQVGFISGGVPSDRFVIRNQGTGPGEINVLGTQVRSGAKVLGTFTGGVGTTPLVVTFQGPATPLRVQALLRAITYRNASDNPPGVARTVRVFLTDGDGEAVGRTKQITIERINDAPELAPKTGAIVGYTRGDSPVGLLTTALVTDPDSRNFDLGRLIVRATEGFHESNRLLVFGGFTLVGDDIQLDGKTIGVKNTDGGVGLTRLEITLNQNATLAVVQRLVRSIRFRTAGVSPTTQRTFELTLLDGDGGTSNGVNVVVNVS